MNQADKQSRAVEIETLNEQIVYLRGILRKTIDDIERWHHAFGVVFGKKYKTKTIHVIQEEAESLIKMALARIHEIENEKISFHEKYRGMFLSAWQWGRSSFRSRFEPDKTMEMDWKNFYVQYGMEPKDPGKECEHEIKDFPIESKVTGFRVHCPKCNFTMWYDHNETVECRNMDCELFNKKFIVEKLSVHIIPVEQQEKTR